MKIHAESKFQLGTIVAHKKDHALGPHGQNFGLVTGINVFVSAYGDHRIEYEINSESFEREEDLIQVEVEDEITIS